MMIGSICYPGRKILMFIIILMTLSLLVFSWLKTPATPEALFREKCSNCHELQSKRLCEFPREVRRQIVDMMRTRHGAADQIDDREADLIKAYLEEGFSCR